MVHSRSRAVSWESEESPFLDLTQPLDERTPVFPGQSPFCFRVHNNVENPELPLYFGSVETMEHTGTHLDAPAHADPGGRYVDELPIDQLIGPGVLLDCADECGDDPDFQLGVDTIQHFERSSGRVAAGSIVLVRTGWSRFFHDGPRYVGTEDRWAWPGVHADAAQLLIDRGIRGIGLDTIGLDAGCVATELAAHRVVLGSGSFILENLNIPAGLPRRLPEVLALPARVVGGSGFPVRVVARLRSVEDSAPSGDGL